MKMLLWAGLALSSALGLAQQKSEAKEEPVPTLHAYTNLVQMPTLVLGENRQRIAPRINEQRFSISIDSGRWFQVSHVHMEGADPISLSILLDRSAADLMSNLNREISNLAPGLLTPRDHVSLYALDCGLTRSLNDVPANAELLLAGVDKLVLPWILKEKTPPCTQKPIQLWDSLGFVATQLRGLPGRRVLLVITDGQDKGSAHKWNEVRAYVQAAGIAVFGITPVQIRGPMSAPVPRGRDAYPLLSVCELSGGMLMPTTPDLIEKLLQQFMTLVRERYILEFPLPANSTKGEHSIQVKIADGERYFVRATGVSAPVPDASILKDPNTVPSDPSRTPEQGKRRVLVQPR